MFDRIYGSTMSYNGETEELTINSKFTCETLFTGKVPFEYIHKLEQAIRIAEKEALRMAGDHAKDAITDLRQTTP